MEKERLKEEAERAASEISSYHEYKFDSATEEFRQNFDNPFFDDPIIEQ